MKKRFRRCLCKYAYMVFSGFSTELQRCEIICYAKNYHTHNAKGNRRRSHILGKHHENSTKKAT